MPIGSNPRGSRLNSTHSAAPAPALVRAVSRWQIVGLSINDVIGSGIYLLPAAAAALLGPASLWAVLLAGLAASLLVLCYAQAASYFDQAGGAYLYTRERSEEHTSELQSLMRNSYAVFCL